MACSNCNKKQIRNVNMQTTQINQHNKNPYVERVRTMAIRSNKKCQPCGYKLNISDTFQQHGIINGVVDAKGNINNIFDIFINNLVIEFQLNQNEKDYLIQQSVNFIKINDAVWTISKIMDNRPPKSQTTPQQPHKRVIQQAKTQNIVQQIQHPPNNVKQTIQNSNLNAKPVANNSASSYSNMNLQQRTNSLFERIKRQNEEMLKKK